MDATASKQSFVSEPRILMSAVDLEGESTVIVSVPSFPMCIDWLPDGRLLIVAASKALLLRREPDGSLVTHANPNGLADQGWNDIVVDGSGQRLRQQHRLRLFRRRVRPRDRRAGHAGRLRLAGRRGNTWGMLL
jgi:hypothetical protein